MLKDLGADLALLPKVYLESPPPDAVAGRVCDRLSPPKKLKVHLNVGFDRIARCGPKLLQAIWLILLLRNFYAAHSSS